MELKVFGSHLEMIRAAIGQGWTHEESTRSRDGAWDLSPLSAETGAALEQVLSL